MSSWIRNIIAIPKQTALKSQTQAKAVVIWSSTVWDSGKLGAGSRLRLRGRILPNLYLLPQTRTNTLDNKGRKQLLSSAAGGTEIQIQPQDQELNKVPASSGTGFLMSLSMQLVWKQTPP